MHFEETETPAPASTPVNGGVNGAVNGGESTFRTGEEFARFLEHAQHLAQAESESKSLRAWLQLAEAWRITQALRECNGNRSAAARLLGIGRRTLYAKMDKLGITPTWSF
jgi:DNA-binding NtrC family response regulator